MSGIWDAQQEVDHRQQSEPTACGYSAFSHDNRTTGPPAPRCAPARDHRPGGPMTSRPDDPAAQRPAPDARDTGTRNAVPAIPYPSSGRAGNAPHHDNGKSRTGPRRGLRKGSDPTWTASRQHPKAPSAGTPETLVTATENVLSSTTTRISRRPLRPPSDRGDRQRSPAAPVHRSAPFRPCPDRQNLHDHASDQQRQRRRSDASASPHRPGRHSRERIPGTTR